MKIGGIYAEIRAKRDKLKTDLDSAERDVTMSAKNMGKSIASIGFAAAGVAAAAFGAAVVTAIKQGVTSYAQLERQMLRTESIIKATGNAAQLSANQMLDLANRLDLATLNDRENILDAINAMQTFRSVSGETFERAIELSVDLAETLGTDLRSQVVQLGKALEDPKTGLTALRRVGVTFTDSQKELITSLVESNKQLEAQGIILDAINEQVGGAAAGAAGGLAGNMDTLAFRWRDFTEALVGSLGTLGLVKGAIEGMGEALRSLTDAMRGLDGAALQQKTIEQLEYMLKAHESKFQLFPDLDVEATKAKIEALKGLEDVYSADFGGGGSDTGGGTDRSGGAGGGIITNLMDEVSDYGDDSMTALLEWEQELYEQKLALQEEYVNSAKGLDKDMWQWRIEGDRYAAMRAVDIEAWQRDQRKQIGIDTAKNLGKALQLMGQQQRWAFEAYKVYATGEAIIAGIDSAVLAWKAGMSTGGPWAPAVAATYAASSLAWTGAQISAIQSASFGGGTGGTTPSGNAVATYDADPTLGTPAFQPQEQEQLGSLVINIEGDFIGDEAYIDNLVEKINAAKDERDVTINYI